MAAQEKQIIDAYNLRYIDSSKSLTIQKKIQLETNDNNIKCISNCFLSLTYLRQKKLPLAKEAIEQAKKDLQEITNQNTLGYYHYALYRYKYFIDESGFEDDILKSLTYFESTKNYLFAGLSAISIANSGELVTKKFLDKGIKYATLSNNNDLKLEAKICESTYLKEQLELNPKSISIQKVIASFENAIPVNFSNSSMVFIEWRTCIIAKMKST